MPERSTWQGGRGGLLGKDRTRLCQFSPPTFARMQFGNFSHFCGPQEYEDTSTLDGWTSTLVGVSTLNLIDRVGGWLQLLGAGLENDGVNMQQEHESFLPAANRDIHFGCSIEMIDVTESDFFIGLATTDTTCIATPPNDLVGFWTHDGDANLDFQAQSTAGGAIGAVDTGVDLVDNTTIELGFTIHGVTDVHTYINGAADTTFELGATFVAANIPAVEMGLAFAFLSGEGQPNDLKIDWYSIVQMYI